MAVTDAVHEHGRTCYWNHLRCRWVCAPAPALSGPPAPAPAPRAVEPAPALR